MTPAILHQNSQSTTTYNQHVSQFPHNKSNLLFATIFQRCNVFLCRISCLKMGQWHNKIAGPLVNRNSFELEKTLTAGFCFGFICGNSLVTRADVGGVDATIPSVPRPSASVFHWRRPPFICAGGVEVTRGKMSLIVTSLLSSSESESLCFIISVPVPTCFFMAPQASSSSKSSSIASDEDGLRYKGARTILKQHHRKKAKFIRGMQCCSEVYLTKRNFVKT